MRRLFLVYRRARTETNKFVYIAAADRKIRRLRDSYMKIVIAFPPIRADKSRSGNRFKSVFNAEIDCYPLVAASAATLLKAKGYDVAWVDAISQGWPYRKFIAYLKKKRPDVVAIQTTTSLIKHHWRVIDDIKQVFARKHRFAAVLMGDHVTALPCESFENSQVDYVLTGGDFDFLLLNLCSQLGYDDLEPGLGFEPGIWYRQNGKVIDTGHFGLNHDLNRLPLIDRDLTKWWLYDSNGSKSKRSRTFTMVARDCGWGQSPVFSSAVLYPGNRFRARSPESLLNEIGLLIKKYRIDEILDVSTNFPAGSWLRSFCQGMISRGYHQKVKLGCWMRLGCLTREDWQLMREAGFRKIFFVLESANKKTLQLLGTEVKSQQLFESVRSAKRAGLEPHVSVMIGFPWETARDVSNTVEFARKFLIDGWIDCLEGKIVTPYPGTKFFAECRQQGWLRSEDWDLYDNQRLLLKNELDDETVYRITASLGRQPVTPRTLIRKIGSLKWLSRLIEIIKASGAVGYFKEIFSFEKESLREEKASENREEGKTTRSDRV